MGNLPPKTDLWTAPYPRASLRPTLNSVFRLFVLASTLFQGLSSNAQSPRHTRLPAEDRDPALTLLLATLGQNEIDYKRKIPDFFCEERVLSESSARSTQRTQTVSTFRLRRIPSSSLEPLLEESRTLRLQDGKPVRGEALAAPAVLEGVFSSGLDPVRTVDRACFHYSLRSTPKYSAHSSVVIRFDLLPATERDTDCPQYNGASGQAWVDIQPTRITRIEMHIPRHEFGNGIVADWRWSATYAGQMLKDQSFWLPSVIQSTAKSVDHKREWKFTAHYTDYHLLHVESRILPP